MTKEQTIKQKWLAIQTKISNQFGGGEILNVDSITYLIGIQELGKLNQKFKKDEKVAIMHIAVCTLLIPYGYYEFDFYDDDGWPHFNVIKELPFLKAGEQTVLLKEAIVIYFENNLSN